MTEGLVRYYGYQHLHFITSSCYRRRPLLGSPESRNVFVEILEKVRIAYKFDVIGYVVMPEHFHMLINENGRGNPSVIMQVLKQRVARRLRLGQMWQARFYDFNVFTQKKMVEKLRYMHRNPVARGLVDSPEQWTWSSYCDYASVKRGTVLVKTD
jgi:putative transposase